MLTLLMAQRWPSPGREKKVLEKKETKEGRRQAWKDKRTIKSWNIREEEEKGKKDNRGVIYWTESVSVAVLLPVPVHLPVNICGVCAGHF